MINMNANLDNSPSQLPPVSTLTPGRRTASGKLDLEAVRCGISPRGVAGLSISQHAPAFAGRPQRSQGDNQTLYLRRGARDRPLRFHLRQRDWPGLEW